MANLKRPGRGSMAQTELSEVLADITISLSETIGAVCSQLVDRGILRKDVLVSDLERLLDELQRRKVGLVGLTIPVGVVAALRKPVVDQAQ
jgi:hypothetical protein